MWFKRKQGNRRLNRRHVLDVKLRSDQIRAARTRLATVACGILFGTVFGLYVLWRIGDWTLNKLVYQNQTFAIQEVEVQTDGSILTDQLRRWANVKPGENLLALDLARVKRDLELVPSVQAASVERVLPRTLRIRVTEREPVAQVNVPHPRAGGGIELSVFHLGADGYVMLPLDPRQRATQLDQANDALPIISGMNVNELQPGRRLEIPQLQAALNLIASFEQSAMAGLVDLRRVDLSAPEVLVATTGQGGVITFGLQDVERQLRRWREIHEQGLKLNKAIATLDLAVTNNIPARWLEASSVPPINQKSAKPSRNRRKNV
jgi:cell division protein FtsQ